MKQDSVIARTGKDAVLLYIAVKKSETLVIDREIFKCQECRPVVAHDPVLGGEPYKSVFVFDDVFYAVLGQPVIRIVMRKAVLLAAKRQTEKGKKKNQQPVRQNQILLQ